MDCMKPAPPGYFWVLHSILFLTVPLYTIAIIALFRVKSTYFVTYKHFLIWHTFSNFLAEIYNSWFVLPVVHTPHPLLRMTGLMTHFGFNGLIQFHIINALIFQTTLSILETFFYRFKASFYNYKTSLFYKYLILNINLLRFILILYAVVAIVTYTDTTEKQVELKMEIRKNYPNAALEIQCFSVVVAAPLTDLASMWQMIVWVLVIFITFTVTCNTTFYLDNYFRNGEHHSQAVVRMQKMLLISLFVQTIIHGVMLGIPNVLFVYAAFFGAHNELVAIIAFACLTFHGFFSTLVMIVFTKPIRISILKMFKCSKSLSSVNVISYAEK